MREIPKDKILVYVVGILTAALAAPLINRVKRTRGKNALWHFAFFVAAGASLLLLPDFVQDEIFSPGGVLLVGTLWPIHASIRAVCSVGEEDDTAWLQYWIASASLSFSTEFVDEIAARLPAAGEHWYEFEFFFNLWLMLPFTDGAALLYDKFTKPYLGPLAVKMKDKCEGWIALLVAAVNASHLWFLWFAFVSLPEEARRFVVVLLGTAYPVAASIAAVTTSTTKLDDTVWLTYWCCFSLLFVIMDYVENFVGHVRGFYSLCAVASVYLFLPMFNGADVVFRTVLVPLSGQHENLLLHDAWILKQGMLARIPPDKQEAVNLKAAEIFLKNKRA